MSGSERSFDPHLRRQLQNFSKQQKKRDPDKPLLDWAQEHYSTHRGERLSLADYPFMEELYRDHHPYTVVEKAAQMGVSEWAIAKTLWFADVHEGTVVYFFPTEGTVIDFSRDRVRGAVESSPYLLGRTREGQSAEGLRYREVGRGRIYFRGMFSKVQVRSIPADMIVLDELDAAPPNHKDQALQRLSASRHQWVLEVSTPTLPMYGVDREFQKSDQRFWHVACGCKEGCVLEEHWPDCVGQDNGTVYLRCPVCGRRVDPRIPAQVGEYTGWVPRYPERTDRRGYHLSQLFSTRRRLEAIMREFRETQNLPEFHNSTLGLPYAGDRVPLNREMLENLAGAVDWVDEGHGTIMGIDQGRWNYAVIWKPLMDGRYEILWIDKFGDEGGFEYCSKLMYRFGVDLCVIDALPETQAARAFSERHPGQVYLCIESDGLKVPEQWASEASGITQVTVNRTECLDAMCAMWKEKKLLWPQYPYPGDRGDVKPLREEFMEHHEALARLDETHPQTGIKSVRYRERGPDHFAHAMAFCRIAANRLAEDMSHKSSILMPGQTDVRGEAVCRNCHLLTQVPEDGVCPNCGKKDIFGPRPTSKTSDQVNAGVKKGWAQQQRELEVQPSSGPVTLTKKLAEKVRRRNERRR